MRTGGKTQRDRLPMRRLERRIASRLGLSQRRTAAAERRQAGYARNPCPRRILLRSLSSFKTRRHKEKRKPGNEGDEEGLRLGCL